ncbi:hypothetical protein SGLAM104S_09026 [Streptomyces glaucescens]
MFGEDYEKLGESLATLARPSNMEKTQQFLTGLIGMDSTPVKNAKEDFNALDEALTNMVKGGKADLASAALTHATENLKDQGFTAEEVRGQLDDYKSALADMAFEQALAAESMGIFGQAALDTEAKLSAQKASADGLRASILALNDANRSAYDSQIQFEAAIDSLSESFAEHGATLNLDTEAGRANAEAMSAAAAAHDEMIASGLAAGESLGSMTSKSDELRTSMMKLATEAFGGNTVKAREYVNTLLGVPSEINTLIKAEKEEAISGLAALQDAIEATPGLKRIEVEALNGAAIAALEAVGLKTKQLPDGRTAVYTANGKSLGAIGAVLAALNNLDGQTADTYTNHHINYYYRTQTYGGAKRSDGLTFMGPTGRLAAGGRVRGYAGGGNIQAFPDGGYIEGPGSGTSDSILALMGSGAMARVSNTEYVVRSAAVQKYGVAFLDALNQGRLKVAGYAKGGKVSKGEAEARRSAWGDLTVSHFGRMSGWSRSEFGSALGRPDSLSALVGALNQWRGIIMKATHGAQERNLLKALGLVREEAHQLGEEARQDRGFPRQGQGQAQLPALRGLAALAVGQGRRPVRGEHHPTAGRRPDHHGFDHGWARRVP